MTVTLIKLLAMLCLLVSVIYTGGVGLRRMDKNLSWRDYLLMIAGLAALCAIPFLYFGLKAVFL